MQAKPEKQKLLLIDDSKRLTITLTDFLSHEGFNVVSAKSGEEALKKLKNITPDIIILDINMPGIGGVGFLNALQKNEIKLKCPILVFTARSAMENFFETLDVAGFIAKPCSEIELLDKIKETLANKTKPEAYTEKRTSKRKILVGEDNPVISNPLEEKLKQSGFDYKLIKSGGALVEAAASYVPNVIVLKDLLQGISGHVAATLLHAMPSTKNIPVILYDETLTIEDRIIAGLRIPDNVSECLITSDSIVIMNAIKKFTK